MANSCDFSQDVFVLDLSEASPPEGMRIVSALFNSYIASFSDEAIVMARVGSLSAGAYNLYAVPVRRSRAPFGEMWLEWEAQAGITLTLILGIDEDAGVR